MDINEERERIVTRLHELAGRCSFCGEQGCPHDGNTDLPGTLALDDVLRAINLDNHFEKLKPIIGTRYGLAFTLDGWRGICRSLRYGCAPDTADEIEGKLALAIDEEKEL